MACIQQFRSLKLNYISRDIISQVKDAESFRNLWALLIDSPHCTCLDVRLLDAMATASLKPEAKEIITNFKNTHYNKTIAEVAPSVPIVPMKFTHCATVHSDLALDPNKMTVFELYKHRFYIEEILELGEALGYHNIRIGSIKINWQIPISFVYKAHCSLEKNHAELNAWCKLTISDTKQWEKLPILWYGQQVDKCENEPLKSLLQDVRQKPYTLHSMFKWASLEFSNVEEMQNINKSKNPVSDNCTLWISTHPGFFSDLYFGVRVCATNKLVGAAISYPIYINVRGKCIKAICLFQKGHHKYLWKRLGYMLIQETMRRATVHGIEQALFGFYTEAIKPLVVRNIWLYKFSDPSAAPLPMSVMTSGWREMKFEDVPAALKLTNQYTSRFEVRQEFQSEEEFSHYFLWSTVQGFIFTYVVEDLSNSKITDMISFRIYHYNNMNIGEMVAIVAGKTPPHQLLIDTLVCAKELLMSFKANSLVLIQLHLCCIFICPMSTYDSFTFGSLQLSILPISSR